MNDELTLEKLQISDRLIKVEMRLSESNGSLKRIETKLDTLDVKIDNILPKCAVHSTKIEAQGGQLRAVWVLLTSMALSLFGLVFKVLLNGR